jgi:hypothetical protein
MNWQPSGTAYWWAIGHAGRVWEIIRYRDASFGVHVADDDCPAWVVGTFATAKALAGQADRAPEAPPSEWVTEWSLAQARR